MIIKNWHAILFAIVLVVVIPICNRYCSNKYETVGTTSDTTKTTTTKITTSVSSFSVEQVGKIKRRALIPAFSQREKEKNSATETKLDAMKDSSSSGYVYVSEIDTNFVAKDSTGKVTDCMKVKSTFISPAPLPENSIHTVSVDHKSFNKETETTTTITNTNIVEKKKNFFDRFKIRPNVSAGYGITSRMFDVYAGIGITFEF